MKILLTDGILINILKQKQGDDECNNHNNAPRNLKMERKLFHPLRCSKFEKSAISMIGIFDRLTKLLNNIKRLDIPVNCINQFDGCCGMDGMN